MTLDIAQLKNEIWIRGMLESFYLFILLWQHLNDDLNVVLYMLYFDLLILPFIAEFF